MRTVRPAFPWLAVLALAVTPSVALGGDEEASPLHAYVARPDDSFHWERRAEQDLDGITLVELRLVSQTWRGIPWKHRLFVVRPPELRHPEQGLMLIEGGSWKDSYEGEPRPEEFRGRKEWEYAREVAERLGMPVAILLNVPFQPLFDGRKEDALIAHTFVEYFKTREPDWPLLLPMVKSAVRGMDAVQQFAREAWGVDVQHFVVGGASKRGWTTWLTGAVDPRVNAIAPAVIDVLNMGPQMKHQVETWGTYSERIHDYTDVGLPQLLEKPEGLELLKVVDPYSYKASLTMPKMILLATNDRYWPVDALNLYWDGLVGEKYVLYVPNQDHGVEDLVRVVANLTAFARKAAGEIEFPRLEWDSAQTAEALTLRLRSDRKPIRALAWIASSGTRDFRDSRWKAVPLEPASDGSWGYSLPLPAEGHAALFAEVIYNLGDQPLHLSTTVRVSERGAARPAAPVPAARPGRRWF
ncbi:MAG: PhoPQ-activated pathogenicity protein [Planctomycetes bacterium]|nr:PhoPQ-activated pathogenicity protein [Planctomycetota bacterium]